MTEPIRITRATTLKSKPKDGDLGFGQLFTDHMFVADFQDEKGWYDPRIEPYGPIALDPAAAVLHYSQAIFDGLKAFRGVDGKVRLFRPQKHVERLIHSAKRMCIPPLDADLALSSIIQLVAMEREWVPKTIGTSLYVRPTIIASEAFLGVRPAKSYIYFVILSPVGAYYPEGMAPVNVKGKWGFVDRSGRMLFEPRPYSRVESFSGGLAYVVTADGKHGYIDKTGKYVWKPSLQG